MGFADDIKKFADGAKAKIDEAKQADERNATARLQQVSGDDMEKITGGVYDQDIGKFHSIVAPDDVLEKLRNARLLRE